MVVVLSLQLQGDLTIYSVNDHLDGTFSPSSSATRLATVMAAIRRGLRRHRHPKNTKNWPSLEREREREKKKERRKRAREEREREREQVSWRRAFMYLGGHITVRSLEVLPASMYMLYLCAINCYSYAFATISYADAFLPGAGSCALCSPTA